MRRWTWVLSGALAAVTLTAISASATAAPKYYFQLQPVKAGPEVNADLKTYTAEAS